MPVQDPPARSAATPGEPAPTRRSQPAHEPIDPATPAFERRADGTVVVRSAALARSILRAGGAVRQAGFHAEAMEHRGLPLRKPILFQEGEEHREQRVAIAPFFTPMAASERYRGVAEVATDELLAGFRAAGGGDLSALSMRLAVRVAAEVVGLTDSRDGRMDRRLDAFFALDPVPFSWRPRRLLAFARVQSAMLRFYWSDVRPAIRARRRQRRDDVISHLLDRGYRDADILIEAVTFGAAGMVTTREFISMAAWHLLQDETLKRDYLARDAEGRKRFLAEVVRLEPVVGHLLRRVERPLALEVDGRTETVEAGTLIDVDIRAANADVDAVSRTRSAWCRTASCVRAACSPTRWRSATGTTAAPARTWRWRRRTCSSSGCCASPACGSTRGPRCATASWCRGTSCATSW
ncbi:MAG: cytochrome P450 [Deinococcales bacterium]